MATEMYDPAHPGEVLRGWIEELHTSVTEFAQHIGVSRVMLSRVLNCRSGITAEMSLRLSAALGTNPSLWFDMQTSYDFAQAKRKPLPKIARFPTAA